MQAGACKMAVNQSFILTKQYDATLTNQQDPPPEFWEKLASVPGANFEGEELTKQQDDSLTKQQAAPRKRESGTGDTDTEGKHATRYKAYYKLVSTGKLTPSIYALCKYEFRGKKIGAETAKIFLAAMERDGIIGRTEKYGKPAYALLNSTAEA